MSMPADIAPRAYNLEDPKEIKRLLLECEGYLRTCKQRHHGTDFEGRQFATEALRLLAERPFTIG